MFTPNTARERIDAAELARLRSERTIFTNERRRPLYFDGRFLAASDLNAEQNYFLQRQASLNLASGFGVIGGLDISRTSANSPDPFRINLAAGSGITPTGEIVSNQQTRAINLADIGQIIKLNAAFGIGQSEADESTNAPTRRQPTIAQTALLNTPLDAQVLKRNPTLLQPQFGRQITGPFRIPGITPFPRPTFPGTPVTPPANEPARSQTGIFIIGLRLVEYTIGSVSSYPTSGSGDGKITREAGEIVEATAVTLIQYTDRLGDRLRSQIAHELFVQGTLPALPANVLPLAMVALDRGAIQWIDNALVRREIGENTSGVLGLNTVPRDLRSAHLQQYDQQLADITTRASLQPGIAAASYFDALPAAGRLPKAALNPSDFTQSYFPPEINIILSVAPTDELAALIEDSLALPPIDLTTDASNRENLSILVVIPRTRQQIAQLQQALANAENISKPIFRPTFPIRVAAPGLIAKRSPLEKLAFLNRRDPFLTIRPAVPTVESLWRNALGDADEIWYIRQRNIPYQSAIVGTQVAIANDDAEIETDLTNRLDSLGLRNNFDSLVATTRARADAIDLLSAPGIARSPILTRSAINALERATNSPAQPADGDSTDASPQRLNPTDVLRVAERLGDPRLGEGIRRLESITPAIANNPTVINILADSDTVVNLDRVARTLKPNELETFSRELTTRAESGDTNAVNALIRARLEVR